MFCMWLGERITDKGIGNGISLIIFAGIVGRLPVIVGQTLSTITAENFMNLFSNVRWLMVARDEWLLLWRNPKIYSFARARLLLKLMI